jgi:hypothetical protein
VSRRADRCPPVPLELMYRVPPGSFRLFMLAAADGRSLNSRGAFDPLVKGERPIGARVSEPHRDRILAETRRDLRTWQRAVRSWANAGLAHQCRNGGVFLTFQLSAPAVCPDCKKPFDVVRTRHSKNLDATSREPSYVQTGEPSTGTQKGEGMGAGSADLSTPEASRKFQKALQERDSENAALARLKETLDAKEEEVAQ